MYGNLKRSSSSALASLALALASESSASLAIFNPIIPAFKNNSIKRRLSHHERTLATLSLLSKPQHPIQSSLYQLTLSSLSLAPITIPILMTQKTIKDTHRIQYTPLPLSRTQSKVRFYSVDNYDMDNIRPKHQGKCKGCGASLHTRLQDSDTPGYIHPHLLSINKPLPPASVHSTYNETVELKDSSDSSKVVNSLWEFNPPPPSLNIPSPSESLTPPQLKRLLKRLKDSDSHSNSLLCTYCHTLRHKSQLPPPLSHEAPSRKKNSLSDLHRYRQDLQKLKTTRNSIIVHVMDALDAPFTYIQNLDEWVGDHIPKILVVNKMDAMPFQKSLPSTSKISPSSSSSDSNSYSSDSASSSSKKQSQISTQAISICKSKFETWISNGAVSIPGGTPESILIPPNINIKREGKIAGPAESILGPNSVIKLNSNNNNKDKFDTEKKLSFKDIVYVSSKTGQGILQLVQVIKKVWKEIMQNKSRVYNAEGKDNVFKNGIDVIFVGRPNVGKSELMNAIYAVSKLGVDVTSFDQNEDEELNDEVIISKEMELEKGLRLRKKTGSFGFATSSIFPGTTVGWIKEPFESFHHLFTIPSATATSNIYDGLQSKEKPRLKQMKGSLIDTPGLFSLNAQEQQLTSLFTDEELKLVVPTKSIRLRRNVNLVLSTGRTLFVGGFVRIDMVAGTGVVDLGLVINGMVTSHVCKTERADEVYERHVGGQGTNESGSAYRKIMLPPLGGKERIASLPPLQIAGRIVFSDGVISKVTKEKSSKSTAKGPRVSSNKNVQSGGTFSGDVAIGGVGWVSIVNAPRDAEFLVWSLGGFAIRIRPSLIKIQ